MLTRKEITKCSKKNLLKKDENFIERFNFIVNLKQAPTEMDLKYYSFFYLSFLLWTFTIHRTAGEGGGYLFNSSLPSPPASQTLRHKPVDCCRELTSARS